MTTLPDGVVGAFAAVTTINRAALLAAVTRSVVATANRDLGAVYDETWRRTARCGALGSTHPEQRQDGENHHDDADQPKMLFISFSRSRSRYFVIGNIGPALADRLLLAGGRISSVCRSSSAFSSAPSKSHTPICRTTSAE